MEKKIISKMVQTTISVLGLTLLSNLPVNAGNTHKAGHASSITLGSRAEDMRFFVTFGDGDLTSYCRWNRVYIRESEIPSLEQRKACLSMAMTALSANMLFDVVLDIQDPSAVDVICNISPTTGQPCGIIRK